MSWKWSKFFQVAGTIGQFASAILLGIPMKPRINMIVTTLFNAIHTAEDIFTGDGTGLQKAKFVSELTLDVAEKTTGKNINNPQTRAMVAEISDDYVAIMNLTAKIKATVEKLDDVIKSTKEPAIPDAP